MKKLVAIFAFVLVGALIFGTAVSALVNNGDFETGTFGSWTKSSFINNGFSASQGSGGSDLSAIVGGPAVAPLSQSDSRTNGAIMYPAYGHYSARVNSELSYSSGGYSKNGNTLTQNIAAYIDPADNMAHIRFAYSAVMVNPVGNPHTAEEKPYFRVRAVNVSNGNDVLYDFSSYVNEPGKNWQNGTTFSGSDTWKYLDWNFIDLTPGPGHPVNPGDTIRLTVTAAGCSLGGHPGYVYVDEISDHEIAGPTVRATGPATTSTGSGITYTYNYRNGASVPVNPVVTATQPTGVTFTSVADPNCSLGGGTVTCNFSNLAAFGGTGSFTINGTVTALTGTQIAHGNYSIAATGFPTLGGQTVLTSVTTVGTTTSVSSSANPSVSGQNVTFTATVAPTSGGGTPTGTVQFVVDGSNFGAPVTLSGGSAQSGAASLSVGAGHTVTAIYSGGPGYVGSSGSLSGGQTVNKANASVGVSALPNPAVSGQAITLTATVGAVAPGTGTPTGTVTFYVDGNPVCTNVALSAATATCNLASLPPGNHVVTVTYSGNGNFNTGNGTLTGGVNVNKANTTLGLASSQNPSVAGEPVTVTATVAPVAPGTGTPTGTVTFSVDGNPVCSNISLSAATATCNLPALGAGNHTVTATYGGDPNFNGSGGTLSGGQSVNKADTTLGLAASPNPSVAGEPVVFTASVTAVAPGVGTPTGTVTFSVDGNPVCTNVSLTAGSAVCNSPALGVGGHTVTATFGGDPNFNGSNGTLSGGQTVNKADTTLGLISSPNPSVAGEPVTVTATVGPVAPGTGTPTGTVTFSLDGNPVCSNVSLASASADCAMPYLTAGNHTVTATYAGDPNFNGSNGTLSGGQVVNKADTTLGLASSPNPSVAGEPVTVTATVSPVAPGAGTPTGTVTFSLDGNPVCSNVSLASASADCALPYLTAGNHTVTATYAGDPNFNGSNGTLSGGQVVNKADTTLGLGASPNPSVSGQQVTFTATVGVVSPGSGTPTGTVTFFADGNPICTAAALSGVEATCNSSLVAGNYVITATYNGDPNFNTSNGTLLGGMTVNKAEASTSVASSVNPSVTGQAVTFTAAVAAVAPGAGTPTGTVTFSVDGSPVCASVALSNGEADCASSAFNAGNHPVAVTYSGDGNFNTSNGSLAGGQNVDKADTTLALAASANPAVSGQSVTFTATISVAAPGAGLPTGSITFYADGNPICSNVALAGTEATCSVSNLSVGGHVITASYGGDPNFNGSNGTLAGGFSVGKANTTTVVTSSGAPSVYGEPIVFTATVEPVAPGSGMPTGTVAFNFGGNLLCGNSTLTAGVASCTLSTLPAGNHVVTAAYSGDGNFNLSAGSHSGGPVTVNKTDSATVITNTTELGSPTHVGESYPVNWTVSIVAPGVGTPTGNVTVSEGSASCSAAVGTGTCTLTSTSPGEKVITASYAGDSNVNPSSASPAAHVVNIMISGHVVRGGSGAPMADVTVSLSGSQSAMATTNAAGIYSFTYLTEGGSFVVTPAADGETFDPISRSLSAVNDNISNVDFVGFDGSQDVRNLAIVNQYVTPGEDVIVPLVLESRGNEHNLGFTLLFDASPLKVPDVACGADAPGCTLDVENGDPGVLGISVTFAGPLTPGLREIVALTFHTHATNSMSSTPIAFGDDAIAKQTWDGRGDPLATTYTDGAVVFAHGFEGDVGGRSSGDGQLLANDVTLTRQLVVGMITANPMYNEFQRADTAPAGTKGDGMLDATDIVQTRRFVAGLDPSAAPGGPFRPASVSQRAEARSSVPNGCEIRVMPTVASSGTRVTVPVMIAGSGDEVASSFTLRFDPMKLSDPRVEMASGMPSDAMLTWHGGDDGTLSVLVDSTSGLGASTVARDFVYVSFSVASNAAGGDSVIEFGNGPAGSAVSDANGNRMDSGFAGANVTISGPNSLGVEVSGRVLTPDGRGLRNAEVLLTDANGNVRTATTSSFGYYRFDGVAVGATYTLGVNSRRYRFGTRTISPNANLSGVDFGGLE
ncbi:MAG: Ig-like domain repeat protein [Pyrinomonadaceae bacterium]